MIDDPDTKARLACWPFFAGGMFLDDNKETAPAKIIHAGGHQVVVLSELLGVDVADNGALRGAAGRRGEPQNLRGSHRGDFRAAAEPTAHARGL